MGTCGCGKGRPQETEANRVRWGGEATSNPMRTGDPSGDDSVGDTPEDRDGRSDSASRRDIVLAFCRPANVQTRTGTFLVLPLRGIPCCVPTRYGPASSESV